MKTRLSPRQQATKRLQEIPGVGPSIAADLYGIGIRAVKDLRGADPQELYARICRKQGCLIDCCLLYVMRCAVYYATEPEPEPELLKWWNWKDSAC
ncbi:MAG: helix-hairpin-helix domain-containing protein [Candidatus Marinimicrobia bacterium]|nr:helix-hairpin-helix domain-containing protein [Candidatus Neomarinimicrobiota bacterium]